MINAFEFYVHADIHVHVHVHAHVHVRCIYCTSYIMTSNIDLWKPSVFASSKGLSVCMHCIIIYNTSQKKKHTFL